MKITYIIHAVAAMFAILILIVLAFSMGCVCTWPCSGLARQDFRLIRYWQNEQKLQPADTTTDAQNNN